MRSLIINGVMFEFQFNGGLTITPEVRNDAGQFTKEEQKKHRVLEEEEPVLVLDNAEVALLRDFLNERGR